MVWVRVTLGRSSLSLPSHCAQSRNLKTQEKPRIKGQIYQTIVCTRITQRAFKKADQWAQLRVSGSEGVGWDQEFACLTQSQVTLLLLVQGPHFDTFNPFAPISVSLLYGFSINLTIPCTSAPFHLTPSMPSTPCASSFLFCTPAPAIF